MLVLVAVSSLLLVLPPNAQDVSRLCLTRALVHFHVSADDCLSQSSDRASYGGHLYSDKAPGLSIAAIPAVLATSLPGPSWERRDSRVRLWIVRVVTAGFAFVCCAFLVGRVSEGLVVGWGGASLVTFALGTMVCSLAPSTFAHIPAAALAFAAFGLAWKRSPFLAGLLSGLAVLFEYEAGLAALALGAYVVVTGGRAVLSYVAGVLPGAAILGAYNWAAFDSPFHLSYRYTSEAFAEQQGAGFFGIGVPSPHGLHLVLVGNRGILVDSPVLLAGGAGLVLLWRYGHRAEASVCGVVSLSLLWLNSGYFLPYGGDSPGPRFIVIALPFLALGLPFAFAAKPVLTTALAAVSVIASVAIALSWPAAANSTHGYRGTVWVEIVKLIHHGAAAPLASWTQDSALTWVGAPPLITAVAVALTAAAAFVIAVRAGFSNQRP